MRPANSSTPDQCGETEVNSNPNRLMRWLAGIFIFAATAVTTAAIFYFANFSGELSSNHESWGTFGDFMGGVLNPILSFLALVALLLTIIIQSKELEATREELKRSATAQENAEESLKNSRIY